MAIDLELYCLCIFPFFIHLVYAYPSRIVSLDSIPGQDGCASTTRNVTPVADAEQRATMNCLYKK